MLVCLYVDDIIYMASTQALANKFKQGMMKMFEMSDLGLLHCFLGQEIKQGEEGVFICQKRYTENLLSKFNMLYCKKTITPMNTGDKLQLKDGIEDADARWY